MVCGLSAQVYLSSVNREQICGDTAETPLRYAKAEMKTYRLLSNKDLQYKDKLSTCIVAHIHQKFVLKNSSSKQSVTLRLLSFFSDSLYIEKRSRVSFSLSPSSLATTICGPSVPVAISLELAYVLFPGTALNSSISCFTVFAGSFSEGTMESRSYKHTQLKFSICSADTT